MQCYITVLLITGGHLMPQLAPPSTTNNQHPKSTQIQADLPTKGRSEGPGILEKNYTIQRIAGRIKVC